VSLTLTLSQRRVATFFIVHVDDLLLIGDDEKQLEFLENVFIHKFEMFKLSFMNIYIGR
jgi:hypothetical protein